VVADELLDEPVTVRGLVAGHRREHQAAQGQQPATLRVAAALTAQDAGDRRAVVGIGPGPRTDEGDRAAGQKVDVIRPNVIIPKRHAHA
jgi:hypothetical protein